MALSIGCVAINVSDVEQAKRFWRAALNYIAALKDGGPNGIILSPG